MPNFAEVAPIVDTDVIVIGAGAAGLAAARSLALDSFRVVVLESRDRIGGRAFSHAIDRALVPAELGAEFIHGPAPETMALLREAGLAAIDTGDESWTFENGTLRQTGEQSEETAGHLLSQASSLEPDESVDRYLQRYGNDASMRESVEAARSFVEGFDAVDPAIASARSIAQEWRSGVDSVIARPLGGYRPMFDYLAGACSRAGVLLHVSTSVRRLSWRRGDVRIETRTGTGETSILHARSAIVTVPAGVLRSTGDDSAILFDPALPERKTSALEQIEMGHVVRIVLSFKTPFWEQIDHGRYRDASFFRCPQQQFGSYWTQVPVRSEQIVAWAGGPKAMALAPLLREDLIDRAVDGFGALFGDEARACREFESAVLHDWDGDPDALGAYSYLLVGGADAREQLAQPLSDTLFFAGEAMAGEGQGGTVNGALHTGYRAAREVAAALGASAAVL